MTRKIFVLPLFTILLLSFTLFSQAQNNETITISTYYPAPLGMYQNLRLFPIAPARPIRLWAEDLSTITELAALHGGMLPAPPVKLCAVPGLQNARQAPKSNPKERIVGLYA